MSYTEFLNNEAIQKAASAFVAAFGGRFVCEEPGDTLVYLAGDGTPYTPPEDSTAEKVLQALEESVKQKNSLLTLWPELEYDPEQDY